MFFGSKKKRIMFKLEGMWRCGTCCRGLHNFVIALRRRIRLFSSKSRALTAVSIPRYAGIREKEEDVTDFAGSCNIVGAEEGFRPLAGAVSFIIPCLWLLASDRLRGPCYYYLHSLSLFVSPKPASRIYCLKDDIKMKNESVLAMDLKLRIIPKARLELLRLPSCPSTPQTCPDIAYSTRTLPRRYTGMPHARRLLPLGRRRLRRLPGRRPPSRSLLFQHGGRYYPA